MVRTPETWVRNRVVNGPTSSSPNLAQTRKLIWSPNHARKSPKVKFGLKKFAMLPGYFDYICVHLRQKVRLRRELSPKFLSTLGPNPARTRPEPDPKSPARLTTLVRKGRRGIEKNRRPNNSIIRFPTILDFLRNSIRTQLSFHCEL